MSEEPAISTDSADQSSKAAAASINPADRRRLIGLIIGAVLVIALIIIGAIFLLNQPSDTTGKVRDVFIIFMALETLVIGAALVILIIQVSILINLIQNELKPIISALVQTVNTMRGTTEFISNNLAEPVIKLNEYMAALKKLAEIIRPKR